MGIVKLSPAGAKVVQRAAQGPRDGARAAAHHEAPRPAQSIAHAGHPVRVIYTAGHWLDVDSVDDVLVGANF
jgi:phosphoenolpyruvate phosphomutase